MRNAGSIIALFVLLVIVYVYFTKGKRTLFGIQSQGAVNAFSIPIFDTTSIPNELLPSQPINWGSFNPNDFLIQQDIPGY